MAVLPTLNSIIICDQAILDSETGKRSLIGIFQRISSQQFPCQHQMLYIYASVTDARGEYVFSIRLVEARTDQELWQASLPPITIKDPLHVQEICVRIMRITFPGPGKYEFQLSANDQLLGLRRINLERIDPAASGRGSGPEPGAAPEED